MSYRAGLIGWKLAARAGVRIKIRVDVIRDAEAGVYVASSPDLHGLTVEAETFEELQREINGAASELLAIELHNGTPPHAKTEIRMSDYGLCAA